MLDLLMIVAPIMFCALRTNLISMIGFASLYLKPIKAVVRSTPTKPVFDFGWTLKIFAASMTF